MATQKINSSEQLNDMSGGWIPLNTEITFLSADSPIFTVKTGVNITGSFGTGAKMWLTHQGVNKNFIVHDVGVSGTFSVLTLYGGTDFDLNVTGAITNPYFSFDKSPFGFNTNPSKWTVSVSNTANNNQASPTANVWYNLGSVSITMPIGLWKVIYKALPRNVFNSSTSFDLYVTLSTTSNGDTNPEWRWTMFLQAASANHVYLQTAIRGPKLIRALVKTVWYMNLLTTVSANNLQNRGDVSAIEIDLEDAYL